MMNNIGLWERYKKYLYHHSELGLMVDFSRMNFPKNYSKKMEPRIQKAFTAEEIASAIDSREEAERVFKLLEHAAANEDHKIVKVQGELPFYSRYRCASPGGRSDERF